MRRSIREVGTSPALSLAGSTTPDARSATAQRFGLADPATLPARRYGLLLDALGEDSVAGWLLERWDVERRMFTFARGDAVRLCIHPGCTSETATGTVLCRAHRGTFEASIASDVLQWAADQPSDERNMGRGGSSSIEPQPCSVLAEAEQCGRPSATTINDVGVRACKAHEMLWKHHRGQGRSWQDFLELTKPYPVPAPCAVPACEWVSTGETVDEPLCRLHRLSRKRADGNFSDWARVQPPAGLRSNEVWFGPCDDVVVADLLVSVADARDRMTTPSVVARLARDAAEHGAGSLAETRASTRSARELQTVWVNRLDVRLADPEEEWERDVIRLKVIDPAKPHYQLPVGEISQPWLRQMVIAVVRAEFHAVNEYTLGDYVRTCIDLSRSLANREDQGMRPEALNASDMDRWARLLAADPDMTTQTAEQRLYAFRVLLSKARELSLASRLQPSFAVRGSHFPAKHARVVSSPGERALPDATFLLLCGHDSLLGERTHELLRSIPGTVRSGPARALIGDMAVQVVNFAANWGRRCTELLSLNADRVGRQDGGGAALRYDNFKSKRDRVWLPIDARQADDALEWIDVLRLTYPDTPLDRLCLFPAPTRNRDGTAPIKNGTFDRWFRIWLMLLEQAIVLAKIAAATGVTIDVLCSLEVQALARGVLTIGTENHQMPGDLSAMLTDYRAEVLKQRRQDGEQQRVPLFPCPFARTGNGAVVAVRPERFDPLGEGWIDVAARYPSGGLPGEHLGEQRIKHTDVEWRRFRHTYLQHLVDAGTDIFLVQELADHSNVGTTIRSYVTTRIEQLTEAVEQLSQWRINRFGEPVQADVALLPTSNDVITNTCSNPQVLRFNKEGCDRGRLCYSCPHFSADPSHLDDVKAEVLTLRKALARFETEGDELRAQVAEQDLAGWTGVRERIESLLAEMSPVERQEVLEASRIVRACRTHARSGSVALGIPGRPRESSSD